MVLELLFEGGLPLVIEIVDGSLYAMNTPVFVGTEVSHVLLSFLDVRSMVFNHSGSGVLACGVRNL